MRVVRDTNVLVSGLLTPFGTCGAILRMLTAGEIVLCVDARILLEYDAVLRRPKFAFAPQRVDAVMAYIQSVSEHCDCLPLEHPLPDEDDNQFLEVALSARALCLVTGNVRHFPKHSLRGMPVLSPQQFIETARQHRTGKSGNPRR